MYIYIYILQHIVTCIITVIIIITSIITVIIIIISSSIFYYSEFYYCSYYCYHYLRGAGRGAQRLRGARISPASKSVHESILYKQCPNIDYGTLRHFCKTKHSETKTTIWKPPRIVRVICVVSFVESARTGSVLRSNYY